MPKEKFNNLEINICQYHFNSRLQYIAFVFVFCTWENWGYSFLPLNQRNIVLIFGIFELR